MGSFASTRKSTTDSASAHAAPKEVSRADSVVREAPKNWVKGAVIGAGAFGKVYLCLDNDSGHLMAVKELEFDDSTSEAVLADMAKEVRLMSKLSHENIVLYHGFSEEHAAQGAFGKCYIFMEYIPGGSLSTLLKKFGRFNEGLVRIYTTQILRGLEYLHSHRIVHRDVKGANILLDKAGVIKLTDFGASKQLGGPTTQGGGVHSLRGTPYYMAPEAIKQERPGRSSDIWSLGCTILQLISGKHPWSECHFTNPATAMLHIAMTDSCPKIPDTVSPALLHLLTCCFSRDPSKRPTASALLLHPFITHGSHGFAPSPTMSLELVAEPEQGRSRSNSSVGVNHPTQDNTR